MQHLILVINPGSTSTKLALYRNTEQVNYVNLHHSNEELAPYNTIVDQRAFREELIERWLGEIGVPLSSLTTLVGRGGLLAPIPGGTYRVNETMVRQLEQAQYGSHASNLGALLAYDLSVRLNIPAYIVDPVVVDELMPVARKTGLPQIMRRSIFHALNHKANAKRLAVELGRRYDELNLIVAHLGGGISVGAHARGQVVDVNNALSGDGPFSPERSGSISPRVLIDYYFHTGMTKAEIMRKLIGNSGLVAHLGTNDGREIERRIEEGDLASRLCLEAMAYQVAKEIGKMSAVLSGEVDRIILTGGLAYSALLVSEICKRVEYIAPVRVLPGENELEALAFGAWRVISGEEQARDYGAEGVNR